MEYTITFHDVTQRTLDLLRSRVESFRFSPANGTEGITTSPDAEIAFRYNADSKALDIAIRRKPLLMSEGQIFGMIADAVHELSTER